MYQAKIDHSSDQGVAACRRLKRLCDVLIAEEVPLEDALIGLRSTIADALACGITRQKVFRLLEGAGLALSFSRFENFVSNGLPSSPATRGVAAGGMLPASARRMAETLSAIAQLDGEFALSGRPRNVLIVVYLLRDEIKRFREMGHASGTICRALRGCGLDMTTLEFDSAYGMLAKKKRSAEHVPRWQGVLESAGNILDSIVGMGCPLTEVRGYLERSGLDVPAEDIEAWYETLSPLVSRRASVVERFLTDFHLLDGHAIAAPAFLNTADGEPLRVIVLYSSAERIAEAWALVNALEKHAAALRSRSRPSTNKRPHGAAPALSVDDKSA